MFGLDPNKDPLCLAMPSKSTVFAPIVLRRCNIRVFAQPVGPLMIINFLFFVIVNIFLLIEDL